MKRSLDDMGTFDSTSSDSVALAMALRCEGQGIRDAARCVELGFDLGVDESHYVQTVVIDAFFTCVESSVTKL